MSPDAQQQQAYARRFLARLRSDSEAPGVRQAGGPGREFLYRPDQVLVAAEDVERVEEHVRRRSPTRVEEREAITDQIVRLRLRESDEVNVPGLVAGLRNPVAWEAVRVPIVQPHYVTVGYGRIMGHPGSPPVPADSAQGPDPLLPEQGDGVAVGICDTGIWREAISEQGTWFVNAFAQEPGDIDPLHTPAGLLDSQAGHGTFVAGVVRKTAPGARIDPERALDPDGFGDEEMLLVALAGLEPTVGIVNLSLGCVTMDDRPPPLMTRALRRLGRDVVVVAAAGNAGDDRPRWPAALKSVIGVAAVMEDEHGQIVEDPDSSYGPWVDACAVGQHTATYVRGSLDLEAGGVLTFDHPYATWRGTSFAAPVVSGRIAQRMADAGRTARAAARDVLDGPEWRPGYGVLVR